MMLLGRPIAVWVIFCYCAYVIAVASYAAAFIWMSQPGSPTFALRDEYGALGLVISMVPASVLFLSGLSLVLLRRWTVGFWALTVLIMVYSLHAQTSVTPVDVLWLALWLTVLGYSVWLWRSGTLR
jgi:hypothetical protein